MESSRAENYREIAAELEKRIEGEIRFDHFSRLLYSTDASMYEIEPIGVVLPRDKGDVQAVIEVANKFSVPILPRGGGTSLAGQTVGHAIVLDFSKYMNKSTPRRNCGRFILDTSPFVQRLLPPYLRNQENLGREYPITSNSCQIGVRFRTNPAET